MKVFTVFFRLLALLLLVAFAEKLIFAAYHTQVSGSLAFADLAHALLFGLRFDLATAAVFAAVTLAVAWLLARVFRVGLTNGARAVGYLAVTTLVCIHGADLLYFDETGRHMGYELKEAYNSGLELVTAAALSYARPVLLQLALLGAALWLMRRLLPAETAPGRLMFTSRKSLGQRLRPELKIVALLPLFVLMVRGGLQPVPLEPLHAQALGDHHKATLALNGVYNAVFSSVKPYTLEPVIPGAPSEADYALARSLLTPHAPAAPAPARNVVFVLLEGWSASHMASYGGPHDVTPRFDALRAKSLTTRDMLAGGRRTTEGMFAAFCSAQNPLGATVAQTQLQNFRYDCLPKRLREQGYHTAFFQGTSANTSGTGVFAQLLGFEHSFGKEHVSEHRLPKNSWGLHDPDIYRFMLEKMAGMPQPFVVGVNTNSTHDQQLPDGFPAPFADSYDNVLRFADAAFGDFVNELFDRFPNTLLVALADHTGRTEGPAINGYRIPFLVHAPDLTPARLDVTASQRDVAPTVLALLGIAPADWFTGHVLTAGTDGHAADYYAAGLLGWVEGQDGIEFPIRQPEQLRCFDAAGLATKACDPEATARRDRALAFTRVAQHALFGGNLQGLAELRGAAVDLAAP
ncbi:MAG: LTA synthase family protein [Gammaproteobacteria bacterium]|nr:LTA synthase family protein [Gammaproteobacteria bacterium]